MRRQQAQQIPSGSSNQQVLKPVGKYWMIFMFVLVIDLAAVILPLLSYFKIASLTQTNDYVYALDGKMQIQDIQVIKEQDNKLENCPQGYHDLFKYNFQGFYPFYLCKQTILPYVEGKTYVDEKEQCRYYADMESKQFTVLKLGKESIRLCGRYLDRNIQLKKECSEQEVVCTYMKEQESYMCAQSLEQCPINKITLNEDQDRDSGAYTFSFNFQRQAADTMPIVDFEIVEGSVKCKNQNSKIFQNRLTASIQINIKLHQNKSISLFAKRENTEKQNE